MPSAVFPVTYLAPVSHFALILKYNEIQWDIEENYHKQFLYNRCHIYGPNGLQKLVIPVHKKSLLIAENAPERTPVKNIRICYDSPWQKIHWRSFEAAYRRSPYFEYYEEELFPLYMEDYHPSLLLDWDMKVFEVICKCIGIRQTPYDGRPGITFTEKYSNTYQSIPDYRSLASPNEHSGLNIVKYRQVFEERHGFLPDLSVADLLFCEGPRSEEYLNMSNY